jgi:hypothetical protein
LEQKNPHRGRQWGVEMKPDENLGGTTTGVSQDGSTKTRLTGKWLCGSGRHPAETMASKVIAKFEFYNDLAELHFLFGCYPPIFNLS